jgi:predicted outer membrane protein
MSTMLRNAQRGMAALAAALLPLAMAGCMASGGAGMAGAPMMPGPADGAAHAFTSAVDAGEIQQAALAQERAADPAVRMFAMTMIAEHSSALQTREARMTQLGMGLGLGTDADAWTPLAQRWAQGGMAASGQGTSQGQNQRDPQNHQNHAMPTSQAQGQGTQGQNGQTVWQTGNWAGATVQHRGGLSRAGMSELNTALTNNPASQPVAQATQQDLQALSVLRGPEFDRAYMDRQVTAHRYALENLDRMIARGDLSPEVLGVMQAMRANVAAHLEMAQEIRAPL